MKPHLTLSPEDEIRYESIKTMIEAERELKDSDLDAVALLAINLGILDQAVSMINAEGAMIVVHTNYGQTFKQNPAVSMMHQTQQSIRSLMDSLLMNPKAKASVSKYEVENAEEDDPLVEILKRRTERGV
ncbi:hypothetical protein EX461_23980 [Vibrio parahaemolyticus]|nr:hypothetical protein [Vibrio parahaemolyticus]EJG0013013.1 P27 family phage terminase small subunit [Vibrio parahaemolyticus]EJG0782038.1 P27 family phage terminase small subunit [Vibrio parahaemolyticus]EJS9799248.1 P27 family phage terminase small subunit [Vibrio parahaemolyticus]